MVLLNVFVFSFKTKRNKTKSYMKSIFYICLKNAFHDVIDRALSKWGTS